MFLQKGPLYPQTPSSFPSFWFAVRSIVSRKTTIQGLKVQYLRFEAPMCSGDDPGNLGLRAGCKDLSLLPVRGEHFLIIVI